MRFVLIAALILHTAVTLWSLRDAGIFAPFPPFSEDYVYQIFSDLGAALLISVLFIYTSVRQQRKPLGGFYLMLILIPLVGSFSPLIYLMLNPELHSSKTKRVEVP
jgi:hypothetical protein